MASIRDIFVTSFNLNKFKSDDFTIEETIDILRDIPFFYLFIYSFFIFLLNSYLKYIAVKISLNKYLLEDAKNFIPENLLNFISSYNYLDIFLSFVLFFLVNFLLLCILLFILKFLFASNIKFKDFFKVLVFIFIPISFLLIFNNIIFIISSSFSFFGFLLIPFVILLYFCYLRGFSASISILKNGFDTSYLKLFFASLILLLTIISLNLIYIQPYIENITSNSKVDEINQQLKQIKSQYELEHYNNDLRGIYNFENRYPDKNLVINKIEKKNKGINIYISNEGSSNKILEEIRVTTSGFNVCSKSEINQNMINSEVIFIDNCNVNINHFYTITTIFETAKNTKIIMLN